MTVGDKNQMNKCTNKKKAKNTYILVHDRYKNNTTHTNISESDVRRQLFKQIRTKILRQLNHFVARLQSSLHKRL